MTGALVVQADALRLPLPDESVDLIVTSPPYAFLRSYDTRHPDLEVGNEGTPQQYLEALWAATAEMVRVLKPSGSIFVDLGDKYAGAPSGPRSAKDPEVAKKIGGILDGTFQARQRYQHAVRDKSLMLLPERYRIGCVDQTNPYYREQYTRELLVDLMDGEITPEQARAKLAAYDAEPKSKGLGLIARSVTIWNKPNGLPESVTDRVRRSHEDWVHLTRSPRYYSAIDEVREPHVYPNDTRHLRGQRNKHSPGAHDKGNVSNGNPLGKLPGSVWTIPSEPLDLPGYFVAQDGQLLDFLAPQRGSPRPHTNGHHPGLFDLDPYLELIASGDGPAWRWMRATGVTSSPWPKTDTGLQLHTGADHYAAFPTRWPEQLIQGFSPPGICVDCGQGRVPVVERGEWETTEPNGEPRNVPVHKGNRPHIRTVNDDGSTLGFKRSATILGYACPCFPPDYFGDRRGETAIEAHTNGYNGWTPPPTRPAIICDPFGGTGTTAMVARALGRVGLSFDLSHAYSRAARWRIWSDDAAKAISRTNLERQQVLL